MLIETVSSHSLSNYKIFEDIVSNTNLLYGGRRILIFVASLIDYKNKPFGVDSHLYENAMFESIQLFGKIATLPCFKEYAVQLLFIHQLEFVDMVKQNDQQLTDSFATHPEWTEINENLLKFNAIGGVDDIEVDWQHRADVLVQFIEKLYFLSFKEYCNMTNISAMYDTPDKLDDINPITCRNVMCNINSAVWIAHQMDHSGYGSKPDPNEWLSRQAALLLPSSIEIDEKLNDTSSIDINENKFHKITANYNQLISPHKNNSNSNYTIHRKRDFIGARFIKIDDIMINREKIGEGGFANVYKGFDIEYKVGTAVKIIEKIDETKLSRYKWLATHEIECLKQLSHDNVIKLLGYNLNAPYQDHDCNCIMFVLEYASNGNLTHLIKQLGHIPQNLARTYFQQIIQGLKACHDVFVVHRDIKCQNILLDANYNIKISDFGLSKVMKYRLSLILFVLSLYT